MRRGRAIVVVFVVDPEVIYGFLVSADFVLGSWRVAVRFQVLKKQVGNKNYERSNCRYAY